MALEINAQVGPQTVADGVKTLPRLGKTAEIIAGLLAGAYTEDVLRGNVFHAGLTGTGVAPGTSIGTTAAFTLYNPAGSGKNLVILQGSMGYVSGTLGAGVVYWVANLNPIAAAVTGSAVTKVNALVGNQTASVASVLYTATLPASPTIIRPFCSLGASLASTAVQPWQIVDDVNGAIAVAPGCAVSFEAVAASGSTPLVAFGITWKELPV